MTYYHRTKHDAEAEGKLLFDEKIWAVRAELEPYNGWVIVLSPLSLDAYKEDIDAILEVAEIDFSRLSRRPTTYKRPPSMAQVKAKNSAKPVPPPKPREQIIEAKPGEVLVAAPWVAKPPEKPAVAPPPPPSPSPTTVAAETPPSSPPPASPAPSLKKPWES